MNMFDCYYDDTPVASYTEIRQYILDNYGKSVSNHYISKAKERLGLVENKNREEKFRLPDDRFELIIKAFEHFGMI